jgi:hypothetical protein
MKIYISIICLLACIMPCNVLVATSGSASGAAEERPGVNYFGTVQTVEQTLLEVEYIAIGSRTKVDGIIVYGQPVNDKQNPRDHRIDVNLALVDKIFSDPQKKSVRYGNVDYYEITVQFKGDDNPKRTYLIESSANLFCDELDGFHNPISHELKFSAVKEVVIKGARSAGLKPRTKEKVASADREERKNHYCVEASKVVGELEQEAEKLSGGQKEAITRLVSKIKNWLGGLCSG